MKTIAFYLPQFHEFEENNRFWGKGFTEWTCLNRTTQPLLDNHFIRRPHPDIGQYCLENREVRKWQAETAKRFGLYGFCYYHYWFNRLVLMDKPLRLMLHDGEPDLPFCFSWANEAWTRKMNGGSGEVLVPASYGLQDEWLDHFEYLLSFFRHRNYILVDNKPMLLIYRPSQIKNLEKRLEFWRRRSEKEGFSGLFLVATLGNFLNDNWGSIFSNFDAAVESFPNFFGNPDLVSQRLPNANLYEMDSVARYICNFPKLHPHRQIPGVLTGFDSYPRSPKICNTILGSTPEKFKQMLIRKINNSLDEFIFINAWNEWGEGATLEPDSLYGYSFLQSLKDGLSQSKIYI